MVVDYSPHDTTWAAIDNAVPFPALRKLDVMCGYLFNDDLLFKGNGGTLRGLGLTFKALALNALWQFNVFNRRGVTWMKFVDIDTIGYLDSALLTGPANAHVAQQIHSILGVAEMIVLRGDTTGELVTDAIKTAPNNAVLRVLEVTDQPLDVGDILSIISAVPSLEALACCVKGSVSGIKALPATEHPDALCKRYSSNSNFRQLIIFGVSYFIWGDASNSENADFCNDMYGDEYEDEDYYHGDADDKVATCGITKKIAAIAAQISVLCPNMRNVVMSRRLQVAFSREIALTMANRLFLPYASTLGRLIFPE
ncbi:hypothetical protein GGI24_004892 [Coemansia furcata]|nr:hypothetical protein GGI24_004892 [Coemansia furcata]